MVVRGADEVVRRTIFGRICKPTNNNAKRGFVPAYPQSPGGARAGCGRLDQGIDGTDADIFKSDDGEASPYALTPILGQRERGSFGEINVAAPDRLLKQRRRDPWVDCERSGSRCACGAAEVILKQMRDFGSVDHGSSLSVRRPVNVRPTVSV